VRSLRTLTVGGTGSRAAWNLADQALSSLSTATDFGRFSVAFAVFSFTLGLSRTVANTPFVIRSTSQEPATARIEGARAAGLAGAFGLATLLLTAPVVLVWGGQYRSVVLAMAVLLPGLFVQDVWRSTLLARGRPAAATVNDLVWVALQVVALAACLAADRTSPPVLIFAWALPGWVAAAVGVWQWGVVPRFAAASSYLRSHLDISRFLVAEYLAVLGSTQLAWLLVAALGSPQDVGALRGALTLLGPLNILGMGVYTFALAEVLRRPGMSTRDLLRLCAALSAGLGLADLAWGGTLLALPDSWGRALLGQTWSLASATLLPLTVFTAAVAMSTGPVLALRSRADTRSSFLVYLVFGPLLLVLCVLGELRFGVRGAAWGYAVAAVATAPLWWWQVRRVLSASPPAESRPSATGEPHQAT